MDTLLQLKTELEQEYNITKKFFDLFPGDKTGYAPHEKSMKLLHLAQHIAEIFAWPAGILTVDYMDIAETAPRKGITEKSDLLSMMEENYKRSIDELDSSTEDDLDKDWELKMKGTTISAWSKYGAIRHSLNQITHHRAQLGVYYRLLNIKLPGSYGPTADNHGF